MLATLQCGLLQGLGLRFGELDRHLAGGVVTPDLQRYPVARGIHSDAIGQITGPFDRSAVDLRDYVARL